MTDYSHISDPYEAEIREAEDRHAANKEWEGMVWLLPEETRETWIREHVEYAKTVDVFYVKYLLSVIDELRAERPPVDLMDFTSVRLTGEGTHSSDAG